ncbi:MAG: HAMP domain-containing protein, partial [Desulfobacteraceae bacterium]
MRIRWKLFLVLLVFSLIPLGVVTLINQHETRRMGAVISQEVGQTFTQVADGVLKLTAEKSATSLANSKIAVEFALLGLTEATEATLARAPGPVSEVYFASDFEEKGTSPSDSRPHPAVPAGFSGSLPAAGRVSYGHPSFLLSPGTRPPEVADDIARLNPLADYLRKCSGRLGKTMLWAYVSLENGLHMAFPGHGGYPAGYDPRGRAWYQGAAADAAWTFPFVDAATGLVIMTATKQIRGADGSPVGVAAIDVLISEVLQVEDLSGVWTEKMRSFLVTSRPFDQNSSPGLLVIAQMDYQAQAPVWKGAIQLERMPSEDSDRFARLVRAIDEGKSGYLEMPHKGVDSIWAYAPIGEKTQFLIIVPTSQVEAFKEKIVTVVRDTTREELVATAGAALIMILLATLAAYFGSRNITRPILELAAAADGLSQGDFSAHVDLKTGDERDQVIDAFNTMVPRLADNLRLQESLRLATEVQ